ncbi:hypothetical protein N0V94_002032 [Neodidymelliopsis sp. IMI 364377]|nr:hypothetical protein N0V94_002032 [Neodidymelliopsis sp. IMI 364377]
MPGSELRLLALDGGGVRGLSALMILEQLMEAVDPDAPPKPCDYFDMIGGTSTGGLIAVMLGRLRMSVADCIAAYLSLSERVFRKTRHRVTMKAQIQGRFDSEELARAIREVVAKQGLREDALLKDESKTACKVFVCATSKETSNTVCLTSYRMPRGNNDLLNSVTIWEACRATSAASTFFDPIAVGRFGEEFVDGATGANNPVREIWDQAQLAWGPEPLEGRVKCLVSIGTGVPSLKPFKDDLLNIGQTLVATATETEKTAEQFRRERPVLDSTGRYYRFNVDRGLEDIGLEEAKKVKEMAAATRAYILTQAVHKQMQACAGNVAGTEYFGEHQVGFSLQGVPRVSHFVDRPAEMTALEETFLPRRKTKSRQIIHVLHGLGGMGKTQLAVEFARRHHSRFSAVLWLDGRTEDSLKRSIASCAGRIPKGQIPEVSRGYAIDSNSDVNMVVKDVMHWLARPDNGAWLLIFDNVDREYSKRGGDPDAYDVNSYLSGADHGSVLITTRLAKLEQLGASQQLSRVNDEQAQDILKTWYKKPYGKPILIDASTYVAVADKTPTDMAEGKRLLQLLDGLPLAIAQAGAYLQQSEVELETYLRFYDEQWTELMETDNMSDAPLQDYPDRSVWTTWAISYQAIRNQHEHTANLLLLWSFLDNKDLWHGLFATACENSIDVQRMLSARIGEIASSEVAFSRAMQLLRNYSLVEKVEATKSYATHPVVHRWAHYHQGKHFEPELRRVAIVAVGWAYPDDSKSGWPALQRRLLPHAQACSVYVAGSQLMQLFNGNSCHGTDSDHTEEMQVVLDGIYWLGRLYADQGKPAEAEEMYKRALQGFENALGSKNTSRSMLQVVHSLGVLYAEQGKLVEAEKMYEQVLQGYTEALGSKHTSALDIVNNLGVLYQEQGKLAEAEKMYKWALEGCEEALGPKHTLTLDTVHNLAVLYNNQGKLAEAEKMYKRALEGCEEALGPKHTSTLDTVYNLAVLYNNQGKLAEAEKMYERALEGYTDAIGEAQVRQYVPALNALQNMGILYAEQGKYTEAQEMYSRALSGLQSVFGRSHDRCTKVEAWVHEMSTLQASKAEPTELPIVGHIPQSGTHQEEEEEREEEKQEKKGAKKSLRRWLRQHVPSSSK